LAILVEIFFMWIVVIPAAAIGAATLRSRQRERLPGQPDPSHRIAEPVR
jgi:hypothetical protein